MQRFDSSFRCWLSRGSAGLTAVLVIMAGLTPAAVAQAEMASPVRASPVKVSPGKMNQPIEPFIKADAIALGKWLVMQKLKTLTRAAVAPTPPTTASTDGSLSQSATSPATTSLGEAGNNRPLPAAERQPALVPAAPQPPAPSDSLTIDAALEMRVALVRDARSVTIAASNGGAVVSLEGEGLKRLAPNQAYRASDQGNLTLDGDTLPGAVWVQGQGGVVAVGDRWYRGRVLLLLRENGILVVNYVMLQEYLYSVVGAEMSASWPIESLKAQAVAARSYALVHNVRHSGREYDLDDTTRYQAYKGVMTETNTTQAAVHQTAGEFISHNGGIVESLYAATQDIVNNAHSGFGMSQMGALDLSRQGYRYNEILAVYYPQTAVGRIDIGE
ncbi:MAG: SpoIID/LytB domain-containing protein [Cyanobacteria bacterium P01_A01_bin.105]